MRTIVQIIVAVAGLATAPGSIAHTLGWGYFWLSIEPQQIRAELQIPAVPLAKALGKTLGAPLLEDGLQGDQDSRELSPELRSRIETQVAQWLSIRTADTDLTMTFVPPWPEGTRSGVETIEGTTYVRLFAVLSDPAGNTPIGDRIQVSYPALFDVDDSLRHGLVLQNNYKTGLTDNHKQLRYVFAPGRENVDVNLLGDDPLVNRLMYFVVEGLYHIWIGLDHILFLVSLLLTAVVTREQGRWQPNEALRTSVWNLVKLITIFTVAHATTLALALKGWVVLPARLVESIIALSILAVVVDNFYPIFRRARWSVVFIFGLFHGLGFAFILEELALDYESKLLGLIGFNIGVELGQIAIVLLLVPVLFALRNLNYTRLVIAPGSVVIGAIALWWFVERAFELELNFPVG